MNIKFDDRPVVIVTGGAGYIGSHTVVALAESGYLPVILDSFERSSRAVIAALHTITGIEIPVIEGDCADFSTWEKVQVLFPKVDAIIHFAAYKWVGESVKRPLSYYKNNLNATLTLLKAMQAFEWHNLVFSSSCTVYGQPNEAHLPVKEDAPKQSPQSPYGQTKLMSEQIIADYASTDAKNRFIFLRYFNPIGAHPSALLGELPVATPENLVPYVTQTAAGIRNTLSVFGTDYPTPDGTCQRDYIHVFDLAHAHVKAIMFAKIKMEQNIPEVFNLGMGKPISVLEIIHAFEKVTQVKLNYSLSQRRSGDVARIWADTTKAEKVLGFTCKYAIEEALLHAWNWQQKC